MKRALTKEPKIGIYYYEGNEKKYGAHADLRGDVSGISGNVSDIRGDISLCEITKEERDRGINILDLV